LLFSSKYYFKFEEIPLSKLLCFLASSLALLLAAPAQATVQRAHVSAAYGADSNTAYNCDAVHPCRFFQAATTVVSSGGEVVALDSGGYGTVTITQSINLIAAPGAYAGISVFAGASGITIATPNVVVGLKGLTINSMGGINGINMTNGSSLTVENCAINNFSGYNGIYVVGAVKVQILNSVFRDNSFAVNIDGGATASISGSQFYGNYVAAIVQVHTAGATSTMTVDHSLAAKGGWGFIAESSAGGTTHLYVTDSVATGNSSLGMGVLAAGGAGFSDGSITNSLVSENGGNGGIRAVYTGAKLVVSGNTITNNSTGLNASISGVIESAGNNTVRNNTTQTAGTITTFGLQ
jgi:hypothetical protein